MSGGKKPSGYLAKYGERLVEAGYEIVPIKRGTKAPPFDKWSHLRADKKLVREWLSGSHKAVFGKREFTYDGARDGIGILARMTPGVDLDVRDADMADALEAFIRREIGDAPVREGMAPKRLMLFRTEEPFTKVTSKGYTDPFDHEINPKNDKPYINRVEILGDGQQFVAFAIHPGTGEPYRWLNEEGPLYTRAEDLPVLTLDDAQAICAEFERLAEEAGWELARSSNALVSNTRRPAGEIDRDDPFADVKQRTEISDEELHKRLLLVPGADDYDTWLQVGMALYHQYDGGDRGQELWHEWSQLADNYDPDALDEKWATFDITSKRRQPVTARLILKLSKDYVEKLATETFEELVDQFKAASDLGELKAVAERVKTLELDNLTRDNLTGILKTRFKAITGHALAVKTARDMLRFENPEARQMPRWLEGWVYCAMDETFFHRDKHQTLSKSAFNDVHNRFMLTKKDILEGRAAPEQIASNVALNRHQIPVVQNRMYMPGEDDLFTLNKVPYVNSYDDRNVPDPPDKLSRSQRAAVEIVKRHVETLFPVERDRRVLIDAMAFLVQNPGRRLNWAIVLQGTEGDGKTFFYRLLAAVLGWENVETLRAQALEEKYTPWAEGRQVVFVEEIKLHGHNRFDVLNQLKPLITNPAVPIRRMNVDTYSVVNQTTYFLATNYRDAMPLTENDSRYFVLMSRFQTKEALMAFQAENPDYYEQLHDALADNAGAMRRWLMDHEVPASFSAERRAPPSVGRLEMIKYGTSEEMEALKDVLAVSGRMDVTRQLVACSALAEEMAGQGCEVPYGKAMTKLLLEAGFTRIGKVRVGDSVETFWSQYPEQFTTARGEIDPLKIRNWLKETL